MPSPSIFYFFIFVHRACLSQSVATKMYISMNNRVSKTLQINNLESVFVVLSAICAISFGYDIWSFGINANWKSWEFWIECLAFDFDLGYRSSWETFPLALRFSPWHMVNSVSVQSLSHVRLFGTPWTAAHQASLSITNFQSPPKPVSIESVMPSNHLILSSFPSPASNLSQHQGLFKWVSSSHEVAKVLEFQLQHQSFQWTLRTDLL